MTEALCPKAFESFTDARGELAPDSDDSLRTFSQAVFQAGALPCKTKELIAIAVAYVTQCPNCIRGHTKAALKQGAIQAEILEAVWIAAEMRSGATRTRSGLALKDIGE